MGGCSEPWVQAGAFDCLISNQPRTPVLTIRRGALQARSKEGAMDWLAEPSILYIALDYSIAELSDPLFSFPSALVCCTGPLPQHLASVFGTATSRRSRWGTGKLRCTTLASNLSMNRPQPTRELRRAREPRARLSLSPPAILSRFSLSFTLAPHHIHYHGYLFI